MGKFYAGKGGLAIFRIHSKCAFDRPEMLLMWIMLINKLFWNISVQD